MSELSVRNGDVVHSIGRRIKEYKTSQRNLAKEFADSFDEYIDRALASGISEQCPYEFLAELKNTIRSRFNR